MKSHFTHSPACPKVSDFLERQPRGQLRWFSSRRAALAARDAKRGVQAMSELSTADNEDEPSVDDCDEEHVEAPPRKPRQQHTDSMAAVRGEAEQREKEAVTLQQVTQANLVAVLLLVIMHFHWASRARNLERWNPALRWVGRRLDESDGDGDGGRGLSYWLDAPASQSVESLVDFMPYFTLLSGLSDKLVHNFRWDETAHGVKWCLGIYYAFQFTQLPRNLAGLEAWWSGKALDCKLIEAYNGFTWFLLNIALLKLLSWATRAAAPTAASWLPATASAAVHFAAFSNLLPWPFLRHPLGLDPASAGPFLAYTAGRTEVATLWIWYELGAAMVPRDFPGALPGERRWRRRCELRVGGDGNDQGSDSSSSSSRGVRLAAAAKAQFVASVPRLAWAAVPWLLAHGVRLPLMQAKERPYAGLAACAANSAAPIGCTIRAVRLAQCSIASQWSVELCAHDAAALVVVYLAFVGGAAWVPRRRLLCAARSWGLYPSTGRSAHCSTAESATHASAPDAGTGC